MFCKEDDINALGKVISDLNDWLEELEEDMIFLSTPSTYSEMEMRDFKQFSGQLLICKNYGKLGHEEEIKLFLEVLGH